MFKKQARILSLVQRLTDSIMTLAAWAVSFYLRFEVMSGGQKGLFNDFMVLSVPLVVLVLIFSTRNQLYESNRYFPWYREFLLVIKSQLQAVATFIIILYFAWPSRLSRLSIGLYLAFGLLFALVVRGIVRALLNRARKRGRNLRHVVVVGSGNSLIEYLRALTSNSERGVQIIGWVDSGGAAAESDVPEILLEDVLLKGSDAPDTVIIGYQSSNQESIDKTLAFFNKTFLQILIVPEVENAFIGYRIEEFHGVPMMIVNSSRMTMFSSVLKRLIDIIGSFLGLIILSPLLIIIGILVKTTSKGPIFYGQERMTLDGETFKMWKFRSMRTDAETAGAQWASKDDDRRTPMGAFLRSTSIDELPQLWNVLVGEMSLVGPRPERPVFIDKFKHDIPSYMLRHRMKAGITGWAQVNGWRGDTSLEKRIEFDIYYIRNWSLFLDIKILFLTVIEGFVNENAY